MSAAAMLLSDGAMTVGSDTRLTPDGSVADPAAAPGEEPAFAGELRREIDRGARLLRTARGAPSSYGAPGEGEAKVADLHVNERSDGKFFEGRKGGTVTRTDNLEDTLDEVLAKSPLGTAAQQAGPADRARGGREALSAATERPIAAAITMPSPPPRPGAGPGEREADSTFPDGIAVPPAVSFGMEHSANSVALLPAEPAGAASGLRSTAAAAPAIHDLDSTDCDRTIDETDEDVEHEASPADLERLAPFFADGGAARADLAGMQPVVSTPETASRAAGATGSRPAMGTPGLGEAHAQARGAAAVGRSADVARAVAGAGRGLDLVAGGGRGPDAGHAAAAGGRSPDTGHADTRIDEWTAADLRAEHAYGRGAAYDGEGLSSRIAAALSRSLDDGRGRGHALSNGAGGAGAPFEQAISFRDPPDSQEEAGAAGGRAAPSGAGQGLDRTLSDRRGTLPADGFAGPRGAAIRSADVARSPILAVDERGATRGLGDAPARGLGDPLTRGLGDAPRATGDVAPRAVDARTMTQRSFTNARVVSQATSTGRHPVADIHSTVSNTQSTNGPGAGASPRGSAARPADRVSFESGSAARSMPTAEPVAVARPGESVAAARPGEPVAAARPGDPVAAARPGEPLGAASAQQPSSRETGTFAVPRAAAPSSTSARDRAAGPPGPRGPAPRPSMPRTDMPPSPRGAARPDASTGAFESPPPSPRDPGAGLPTSAVRERFPARPNEQPRGFSAGTLPVEPRGFSAGTLPVEQPRGGRPAGTAPVDASRPRSTGVGSPPLDPARGSASAAVAAILDGSRARDAASSTGTFAARGLAGTRAPGGSSDLRRDASPDLRQGPRAPLSPSDLRDRDPSFQANAQSASNRFPGASPRDAAASLRDAGSPRDVAAPPPPVSAPVWIPPRSPEEDPFFHDGATGRASTPHASNLFANDGAANRAAAPGARGPFANDGTAGRASASYASGTFASDGAAGRASAPYAPSPFASTSTGTFGVPRPRDPDPNSPVAAFQAARAALSQTPAQEGGRPRLATTADSPSSPRAARRTTALDPLAAARRATATDPLAAARMARGSARDGALATPAHEARDAAGPAPSTHISAASGWVPDTLRDPSAAQRAAIENPDTATFDRSSDPGAPGLGARDDSVAATAHLDAAGSAQPTTTFHLPAAPNGASNANSVLAMSPVPTQGNTATAHLEERLGERRQRVAAGIRGTSLPRNARAEADIPDLGRVAVEARPRGSEIDVRVTAQRPEAARAIQEAAPSLESHLRDNAVPLGHLSVGDRGAGPQNSPSQGDPRHSAAPREPDDKPSPAKSASPLLARSRVRVVL